MRSLRQIIRRLQRSPGFTAVALVTLAVGIGANTAIFSVVNAVLLKPLPYPDSDRLISMMHQAPGVDIAELGSSLYLYFTERDENQTLDGVGLWGLSSATVTGAAQPERVQSLGVTADILPILGVEPMLGRYFSAADASPGAAGTIVLSYGYWQRHFGGDSSAVGQSLIVDGQPRDIIGVMPQSFRFLDERVELIAPFQIDRNRVTVGEYFKNSIARMKPGVTLEQVSADVRRMVPIAIDSFPIRAGETRERVLSTRIGPNLRTLKQEVVGDVSDLLWVLMGTIGIVLLIACANVANLLLVRAEGRQHEMAIRAALGAGWSRLAGEVLLESIVLSLLGGLLGIGVAYVGLEALIEVAPGNLPRVAEIAIDGRVLAFAVLASVASGLLCGLFPALRYTERRLATGLHAGGRAGTGSVERQRARSSLVVVQVAFALVLLISAGLMIRTFQALSNADPGFTRPDEVLMFGVDTLFEQAEDVTRAQNRLVDQLAAIPGVTSVAFASSPPMGGPAAVDLLVPEGRIFADGDRPQARRFKFVSPGFFATAGTPLVAGRDLTWTDTYERRPVTVVSENLARLEWGSPAEALGKRLRGSSEADDWREIIGVVGNVLDDGVAEPATEIVYVPALVERMFNAPTLAPISVTFLIRSPRAGTPAFLDEVRSAIWDVNPDMPLANVRTLESDLERSLARTSLTLMLLAIAGVMALLLGVVGIYGVIAYAVSQHTRDIGIRMALGAQNWAVQRLFLGRALVLASAGIVLGLLVAAGLSRLVSSLLYGVSALDPATYAAVCVLLAISVVLSSYVPTRRAARIDPMEALRAE